MIVYGTSTGKVFIIDQQNGTGTPASTRCTTSDRRSRASRMTTAARAPGNTYRHGGRQALLHRRGHRSHVDRTEGGTATKPRLPAAATSGGQAFDNRMTNYRARSGAPSVPTAAPISTVYDFAGATAYTVTSYTITSGNDVASRDPKDWTFQGCQGTCTAGSDTGWVTLDTRTNQCFGTARFSTTAFTFSTALPTSSIGFASPPATARTSRSCASCRCSRPGHGGNAGTMLVRSLFHRYARGSQHRRTSSEEAQRWEPDFHALGRSGSASLNIKPAPTTVSLSYASIRK